MVSIHEHVDTVEKIVRKFLTDIGLKNSFSFVELLASIESTHGRLIKFTEIKFPRDVFGMCLRHDYKPFDLVVTDSRLSRVHKEYVKLHEIGHLVMGHDVAYFSSVDQLETLLKNPSGALRCSVTRSREQELVAETFALYVQSTMVSGQEPENVEVSKFQSMFGLG